METYFEDIEAEVARMKWEEVKLQREKTFLKHLAEKAKNRGLGKKYGLMLAVTDEKIKDIQAEAEETRNLHISISALGEELGYIAESSQEGN
mmetsp:Transcript_15412/g.22372  ORF Transcript_15412/g.22372 Transcript_15412/m.22372 type:complete len:92 (-) Transcript_15412:4-279(-)